MTHLHSRFTTDRRAFLRGLAIGTAGLLAAPLASRRARAQTSGPRRFVFVLEGNGFEPVTMLSNATRAALEASNTRPLGDKRWWHRDYAHAAPIVVGGAATPTDLSTAPALGALAPTDGSLDLRPHASVLMGLSSLIIGGGHSGAHGVLSATRSSAASPGGQTIDAFLAALPAVRGQTPFDAVRLGVSSDINRPLDYGTCAYGRGRPAALMLQPQAAYQALFGAVASAESMRGFQDRAALLDFARADVQAALSGFSGAAAERAKLETYLDSLNQVAARGERLLQIEAESAGLSTFMPTAPAENPLYQSDAPLDRFAAQLELGTAALRGGLTNVLVVGSGTGGDFGLTYTSVHPVTRHDLHHQSANVPAYLAAIHEVTRRQVALVCNMARTLAATPEPGHTGTMLDHTAIVFIGDNGEQHHSTASDFPVLVLGGSAMGLQGGGRTVVYPGLGQAGHRQVSNLLTTLAHAAGEPLSGFGEEGPTRVHDGPLTELWSAR